jgi:hypothetical protein
VTYSSVTFVTYSSVTFVTYSCILVCMDVCDPFLLLAVWGYRQEDFGEWIARVRRVCARHVCARADMHAKNTHVVVIFTHTMSA